MAVFHKLGIFLVWYYIPIFFYICQSQLMWAVDLYFIDLLIVDKSGFLNSTFATAFKLINQVFTAQAIGQLAAVLTKYINMKISNNQSGLTGYDDMF